MRWVHVGGGAVLGGVAGDDALAQVVDVARHVDLVALALQRDERTLQRLEHGEVGRGADVAGVGREVEQDDADLALRPLRAAQGDELADARGQHVGALAAGMHGAGPRPSGTSSRARQPVHVPPAESERPPNTIGPVAPSSSGIATMIVVSTGIRPRSDAPHCSKVWNSAGWAAM